VASKASGLRHDNFYSAMLYDDVAYHEYEGVTTNLDEQPRLVASLGSRNHMILRNHGLLVVGPDVPTAFNRLWVLQRACEIQLASDAGSGPNSPIPEAILRTVPRTRVAGRSEVNRLIFDTMLRRAGILP
jgi:ribulose-5-phosphate 4-epimerase/fuculose-1-phosphate aldolase